MRYEHRSAKTAAQLIRVIAWEAAEWRAVTSLKGKPGELIERLPERERDIIRTLKAEDMNDVRAIYG